MGTTGAVESRDPSASEVNMAETTAGESDMIVGLFTVTLPNFLWGTSACYRAIQNMALWERALLLKEYPAPPEIVQTVATMSRAFRATLLNYPNQATDGAEAKSVPTTEAAAAGTTNL